MTKKNNPLIIQLFFSVVSSFGFRASGFSPTHNIYAVPEITYCDYLWDATLDGDLMSPSGDIIESFSWGNFQNKTEQFK
jgi:hypothetical protein